MSEVASGACGANNGIRRRQAAPRTSVYTRVYTAVENSGLLGPHASRANAERNFQMAEAKWPVCKEDTADRPLRPGRLPSTSERIAWERAGAARGLWLCCVGRSSPMGIDLPPRLARDPSPLPPFRKFISAFALSRHSLKPH